MFNISGPFTAIKFALEALATAFANNVFPQPGGPHNNTPAGGLTLNFIKTSGFWIGNTRQLSSSYLNSYKDPMSDQVTSGITANPSLFAVGWTFFNANSKSIGNISTVSSLEINLFTASTAASLLNENKSEATYLFYIEIYIPRCPSG